MRRYGSNFTPGIFGLENFSISSEFDFTIFTKSIGYPESINIFLHFPLFLEFEDFSKFSLGILNTR